MRLRIDFDKNKNQELIVETKRKFIMIRKGACNKKIENQFMIVHIASSLFNSK